LYFIKDNLFIYLFYVQTSKLPVLLMLIQKVFSSNPEIGYPDRFVVVFLSLFTQLPNDDHFLPYNLLFINRPKNHSGRTVAMGSTQSNRNEYHEYFLEG